MEDTKIPKACRLLKLHLLDLRVALRIVAVRAAKMMRVSNLARGKALLLDFRGQEWGLNKE